jgi:RNA polymerase sigma factor (sigma-70 family)
VAAAVPESQPAIHELAFEQLYRRYVKDVYRYTLALLQNPADAEDVTQTTFLNAWRAYRSGVQPIKPHNWLIKIAHNAARTRYAISARRPQEVAFDERAHELPVPPEGASELQGVLQALAKLPFNQRSALVMRELEGRSYSEIAETLEVSVSAVETLIFRARRSLRLDRAKLHALGAIQLPPSLAPLFGSGSGAAVVGGGAVVGSGVLAKAAIVIAAGVAAGGVGFSAVHAADRVQSSSAISQGPVPVKAFSPVASLLSRAPAITRRSAPVGQVIWRAGRPRVYRVDGAAADGAAPTVLVDRAGSATGGATASEPGQSGSVSPFATSPVATSAVATSPVATSLVTSTTSTVTSVVPQVPALPELPSAPVVSSPIQVPSVPALPPLPPLPLGDLPPPPKLP